MKLNVLLAKTDHSSSQFKKLVTDYVAFFKGKQGEFKGVKKTYNPRPETQDLPEMRGFVKVVTTVEEKLDYLEETAGEHIDNLFSIEATNASGTALAELIVEGVSWGTFSSLELLRLKSLLEAGELEQMYSLIPVRSDSDIWNWTTDAIYDGRDVQESPLQSNVKKSIVKTEYILEDPNLVNFKDMSKYTPIKGMRDSILELGDYTVQHFTGEYTHEQRAFILRRRSKLLSAVIEALKNANDIEQAASGLTAAKIFGYLHEGQPE